MSDLCVSLTLLWDVRFSSGPLHLLHDRLKPRAGATRKIAGHIYWSLGYVAILSCRFLCSGSLKYLESKAKSEIDSGSLGDMLPAVKFQRCGARITDGGVLPENLHAVGFFTSAWWTEMA
jgi:hypothetical protein